MSDPSYKSILTPFGGGAYIVDPVRSYFKYLFLSVYALQYHWDKVSYHKCIKYM